MLKLKRLKVIKFRHVEPTELAFDDRYNVPLGINGSGKTTLLKLISACLRSDFSAFKDEEFDVEYELAAGEVACMVAVTGKRNGVSEWESLVSGGGGLHPTIEDAPFTEFSSVILASLAPSLSVRTRSARGQLHVSINGGLEKVANASPRSPSDGPFLVRTLIDAVTRSGSVELKQRVNQIPWGQLASTRPSHRFDESLELLERIAGVSAYNSLASITPLIRVATTKNGEALGFGAVGELVPDVLMLAFYREQGGEVETSGTMTFASDRIDPPEVVKASPQANFLKGFAQATGFSKAELTLKVIKAEETETEKVLLLGGATFRFHTKRGVTISHELLSYGQKRLLSFLYYVACNDAVVVADELVNGLHHAWIEVCLDAIGERQAFLTSQNPILLDYVPPASPAEAERRFIRCMLEEREGRDVMVWRNLTPDEAREFCAEYAVGVQQVSELLRVQGLW